MKRRIQFLLAFAAVAAASAGLTATGADSPRIGDERVLLRTTRGDLVLAFYPDVAPKHIAQILKLVRMGVYDSTWIQRVEPNYVVQLSNVQNRKRALSPEQLAAITKLPAEFSSVPHRTGTLSMAREPADPNSAETSFSMMLNAAPHLDGKYTVFGEVEFGMPLLSMLANEPRDQGGCSPPPAGGGAGPRDHRPGHCGQTTGSAAPRGGPRRCESWAESAPCTRWRPRLSC